MITYILLNKKSYAQKSVCHDQFNGFQIDEQYNRNDPPSTNTEIEINHYLHKIDEVESLNLISTLNYSNLNITISFLYSNI